MLYTAMMVAVATAGAPQVAASAPTVQTAAVAPVQDKPICRRVANIGSNIPSKKMCYTRAQWDALSRNSQALKRSMDQPWTTPNQ